MNKLYLSVFMLASSLMMNAQIPQFGLMAYYTFDGNTIDSSGMGNNAVPGGCSFVEDRFGQPAAALSFNGTTDSLVMPVGGFAPITGDFTISFWAKTSSPEAMSLISLKDFPDDTTQNFEFQFNSTSSLQVVLELYYSSFTYWNGSGWAGNNLSEGSSGRYYNGKWQHYMIRRVSDTMQVWHNLYNTTPSNSDFYYSGPLGSSGAFVASALPHRFEGSMDDIAFYDHALSDSEMRQLYFNRMPFEITSPKSTDAYVQGDTAAVWWRWDEMAVSDSVLLEYRLNGGNWQLTNQNQLVDWTPFYFPLNYPPGTTVELRLTDKLNPSITTSTGTFRVSEYVWENVTPTLPFTSRDGSGLLNFDGKMWLIGGWDPPYHPPNYTHSEVWNSTDGITWNFVGDAPWPGRHCSGWLVHDSAMWVIGGDPQSGYLRDVWKSIDGINWTQILDSIPGFSPLRSMHMTASFNGNIYNFGGSLNLYVHEDLKQVWKSPDGINWTQLPDAPWKGRSMVINSCVDDNDTMWLLGGGRLWDRRCYNDVWKTADGITWEIVNAAAPWQSRYWHNVAWFDNKMWVLCGISDQTNSAETWYSSDGIQWYELKNPKYADRHAASATVFNNYLWLMCGIISNDVWRLRNTTSSDITEGENFQTAFDIFPNPSKGIFTFNFTDMRSGTIEVFNALGERIFIESGSLYPGKILDLRNNESGVYLVKVKDGEMVSSRKLVIE